MVDYENMELGNFSSSNKWGIPDILPQVYDTDVTWQRFNFCYGDRRKDKKDTGVHFMMYDTLFTRVWNNPKDYNNMLGQYGFLCAPDFSSFGDWPDALNLYNHYRKHWLARYWQEQGFKVLPKVNFLLERQWDWCFDGVPRESAIVVSTVGNVRNKEDRELFVKGYAHMKSVLNPSQILVYGKVLPCMDNDNIIWMGDYNSEMERRGHKDGNGRKKQD